MSSNSKETKQCGGTSNSSKRSGSVLGTIGSDVAHTKRHCTRVGQKDETATDVSEYNYRHLSGGYTQDGSDDEEKEVCGSTGNVAAATGKGFDSDDEVPNEARNDLGTNAACADMASVSSSESFQRGIFEAIERAQELLNEGASSFVFAMASVEETGNSQAKPPVPGFVDVPSDSSSSSNSSMGVEDDEEFLASEEQAEDDSGLASTDESADHDGVLASTNKSSDRESGLASTATTGEDESGLASSVNDGSGLDSSSSSSVSSSS